MQSLVVTVFTAKMIHLLIFANLYQNNINKCFVPNCCYDFLHQEKDYRPKGIHYCPGNVKQRINNVFAIHKTGKIEWKLLQHVGKCLQLTQR